MSHATTIGGGPLPSAFGLSGGISRAAVGVPAADSHSIDNPLWIIVIGMACFFGTAALIIAWG